MESGACKQLNWPIDCTDSISCYSFQDSTFMNTDSSDYDDCYQQQVVVHSCRSSNGTAVAVEKVIAYNFNDKQVDWRLIVPFTISEHKVIAGGLARTICIVNHLFVFETNGKH